MLTQVEVDLGRGWPGWRLTWVEADLDGSICRLPVHRRLLGPSQWEALAADPGSGQRTSSAPCPSGHQTPGLLLPLQLSSALATLCPFIKCSASNLNRRSSCFLHWGPCPRLKPLREGMVLWEGGPMPGISTAQWLRGWPAALHSVACPLSLPQRSPALGSHCPVVGTGLRALTPETPGPRGGAGANADS